MSEVCVVVAEIARARILTLEPAEVPGFDSGPRLVEQKALANTRHKAKEGEYYTETRRGAHKNHTQAQSNVQNQTAGVPHHNYSERREDSERQTNRSFAKDIVSELEELVQSNGFRRVVLCAETQMLGYLRPELSGHLNNVKLEEVPKDLTNFTPHELHQKLAKDGLLPERKMGAGG